MFPTHGHAPFSQPPHIDQDWELLSVSSLQWPSARFESALQYLDDDDIANDSDANDGDANAGQFATTNSSNNADDDIDNDGDDNDGDANASRFAKTNGSNNADDDIDNDGDANDHEANAGRFAKTNGSNNASPVSTMPGDARKISPSPPQCHADCNVDADAGDNAKSKRKRGGLGTFIAQFLPVGSLQWPSARFVSNDGDANNNADDGIANDGDANDDDGIANDGDANDDEASNNASPVSTMPRDTRKISSSPPQCHAYSNADADAESLTECPDDDVEGQFSSRSSPVTPSRGTKSKKHPRKRKRSKNHKNIAQSKRKQGGSRLVLNKSAVIDVGGKNDRTCLLDAISQILPNDKDKARVCAAFTSAMPAEGDTSIMCANHALSLFGMTLERVSERFHRTGGPAFHLMQEHECRLIINIKLTNHSKQTMSHFVAWDGKVIHDRPHESRVNNTSDRADFQGSKSVFRKLYNKKKFLSWQITNVYELAHTHVEKRMEY